MNGFDRFLIWLFLIGWVWGGLYLMKNFNRFFGPHRDDPAETSAARSFGQPQIWVTWLFIILALLYYLLF